MEVGVLNFPGSFGFNETVAMCERYGCSVKSIWIDEERIPDVELVILPSGASFGDYLRPGALAARTRSAAAVKAFARSGGKVLGIGNGFQILCEIGLLPGVLLQNTGARFHSTQTYIRYEGVENFFFKGLEKNSYRQVPLVCGYGAYFADKRTIQDIEEQGLVIFRYVDQFGTVDDERPTNGSIANIAAVKNVKGNVVGIMPRIERVSGQIATELCKTLMVEPQ